MGNADLCTCCCSLISTLQQNPPICAGESTNFLVADNLLQSFLPRGGNNYFACVFLIIDFLLLNCKFCHYVNCDLFILWWQILKMDCVPPNPRFLFHPCTHIPATISSVKGTPALVCSLFAPCFSPRIDLEFLMWWYLNNSLHSEVGPAQLLLGLHSFKHPSMASEYWIIYSK